MEQNYSERRKMNSKMNKIMKKVYFIHEKKLLMVLIKKDMRSSESLSQEHNNVSNLIYLILIKNH